MCHCECQLNSTQNADKIRRFLDLIRLGEIILNLIYYRPLYAH